MWLSLVEHYVRDVGAAGSNPVIPTTFLPQLVFRGVAQLVARASGGRGAAGSSPVTPTIPSVHNVYEVMNTRFFVWLLLFHLK